MTSNPSTYNNKQIKRNKFGSIASKTNSSKKRPSPRKENKEIFPRLHRAIIWRLILDKCLHGQYRVQISIRGPMFAQHSLSFHIWRREPGQWCYTLVVYVLCWFLSLLFWNRIQILLRLHKYAKFVKLKFIFYFSINFLHIYIFIKELVFIKYVYSLLGGSSLSNWMFESSATMERYLVFFNVSSLHSSCNVLPVYSWSSFSLAITTLISKLQRA